MFHCCISRSKLIAVIDCWPFPHALMVAFYVMTLASMFHCRICRSKLIAGIDCWPFSNVLMVALYVITLESICSTAASLVASLSQ